MAVFIFGAGATRGCSFVNPAKDPCLPPLDADFFTQLQRVQNEKHRNLVKQVVKDVVEMFGSNFNVTMETVFTTLEHTVRMLATTGENRAFKRKDLSARRDRLEQAIAILLEDSLAQRVPTGGSRLQPRSCKHHNRFVLPAGSSRLFHHDIADPVYLKVGPITFGHLLNIFPHPGLVTRTMGKTAYLKKMPP